MSDFTGIQKGTTSYHIGPDEMVREWSFYGDCSDGQVKWNLKEQGVAVNGFQSRSGADWSGSPVTIRHEEGLTIVMMTLKRNQREYPSDAE